MNTRKIQEAIKNGHLTICDHKWCFRRDIGKKCFFMISLNVNDIEKYIEELEEYEKDIKK